MVVCCLLFVVCCLLVSGRDEFGAVFGDALVLCLLAHHEASDVLQEQEGDPALAAQLHEVCRFQGRLREEDPLWCGVVWCGVGAVRRFQGQLREEDPLWGGAVCGRVVCRGVVWCGVVMV